MGMDLLAVRPKARSPRSFEVNRPTWRTLRSLLLRLGCDIREMSDLNDGARIRAATCRQWARALRGAIPALHIVKVRACLKVGGTHDAQAVSRDVMRIETWGRSSPRTAASIAA